MYSIGAYPHCAEDFPSTDAATSVVVASAVARQMALDDVA
jgi:hypothetical protein